MLFARLRIDICPDSFLSTGVDAPFSAAWVNLTLFDITA